MRENKRKHLEFIQGVVNRLSTNSFLLKGWSVGLVSALFALAAINSKPAFLLLTYIPAIMFWGLYGYCLWQERLYRCFFDIIRKKSEEETDFSMSVADVPRDKGLSWIEAVFSKTLLIFHGTIVLSIIIVMSIGLR